AGQGRLRQGGHPRLRTRARGRAAAAFQGSARDARSRHRLNFSSPAPLITSESYIPEETTVRLTKYAAIAGALAIPLAVAAPASATSGATGSAFGISASGLVPIPPTPSVTSEHPPSHKALLELPPNPLIDLGLLRTDAHPGRSRASVLDLKIARA